MVDKHIITWMAKRVYRRFVRMDDQYYDDSMVDFRDQEANDYIYDRLTSAGVSGLMISKFGTRELDSVSRYCLNQKKILSPSNMRDYIYGRCSIYHEETLPWLCNNAGFFPEDALLEDEYDRLVIKDMEQIDILASYVNEEKYFKKELTKAVRVNLNGFYAPFLWDRPWTVFLKGKKVLVVHPFVDSIEKQYQKRAFLFENTDVLPELASIDFVKAVQTIGCNADKLPYKNWFEALEYMESEIDKKDYEVAIIGCGAYGMNLAAHVKRQGKIAIHLAGWTQMLFGIYGNRWIEDQPEFKKFINQYWIRPSDDEKPAVADDIENGCYW